jgi:hypothetical protein
MRCRRAVVAVTVAVASIPLWADHPAGAASDSGAQTRVVGRGDIVTSILGWSSGRSRPSGSDAPRCVWRTLSDAQLEWVVSVAAFAVALGFDNAFLDPLQPHLDADELPDGDLQVHVCDGAVYELRFVPSAEVPSTLQLLYRRMITRLPPPDPTISPPGGTAVPVGQPVFISIDDEDWAPVEGTLSVDGITAQVRAEPVDIRVITGDPRSVQAHCKGPGRAFRPGRGGRAGSAAEQARHPDACTVVYRTASAGHRSPASRGPVDRRPDTWLGTVTVVWEAQWRVADGPWIDLGRIPRTRLITRTARDVTTSIEDRRE